MKCPDCGQSNNIKWMLRHQKIDKDDNTTNANVITVLCTDCGKNESIFISDYLEDLFPSWDDRQSPQTLEGSAPLIFDDELFEDEEKGEKEDDLPSKNDES